MLWKIHFDWGSLGRCFPEDELRQDFKVRVHQLQEFQEGRTVVWKRIEPL